MRLRSTFGFSLMRAVPVYVDIPWYRLRFCAPLLIKSARAKLVRTEFPYLDWSERVGLAVF